MMTNCIKCGSSVPPARINLGYKVCVSCSDTEMYGMVNVIVHKTGNSVQPLPKSQADAINKVGDRKRFGTILKGGSKSTSYKPTKTKFSCSTTTIGSDRLYMVVGEEAMRLFERSGYDRVVDYINKAQRNFEINQKQANQLLTIFNHIKQ